MTALAWTASYAGWGRGRPVRHRVLRPASADEAAAALARATGAGPVLAHGCGRSYGDVALNPDGLLIDCRALDRAHDNI